MSRGPTYTEAHRNACEVAMLAALPAARRRAFFMGSGDRPKTLEQLRGRDAAVALFRQVRQALGGRDLW